MPRTRINISSGYLFLKENYRQDPNTGKLTVESEYAICSTAITLPNKHIKYVEYNLHLYLSNSQYSEFECDLTEDGDVGMFFSSTAGVTGNGTWINNPPTSEVYWNLVAGQTGCFMFEWSELFSELQYNGESIESSSVSGYIDIFWEDSTTIDLSRYDLNVLLPDHETGDFVDNINMGPDQLRGLYVGNKQVISIYKGSTQVYGSGSLRYFYNFYRHEQLYFDEMASKQYVNGTLITRDWTYIQTITAQVTPVSGVIRQVEFDVLAAEDAGDYVGIMLSSPDEKFYVNNQTSIRITWDCVLTITRV